ncbi:D-glycerate 3-kinase, chloroplastic [Dendrobium catenatum]|uniref:D-glycerate 3-kinase, chloroplastic n=1 Tax=Dendrobium catenatum TaxID=906689 RepID=A0A2I0WXY6_9ASPA|nr:D-glycerate 3-kinase, chloroplastic [Dendrobium catenatum]
MATLTTISPTSCSSLFPFRSQPSPFIHTADPSIAPKSGRPPQTLASPRYSHFRRFLAGAQPVFPTSSALVSSLDDLFEFICTGPLLRRMGFTTENVAEGIDKWLLCGGYLCRLFGLNELQLTAPEKARVYHFYVPVFLWCEKQIERHVLGFGDAEEVAPLVIGVSAPQGSGKTTLVLL